MISGIATYSQAGAQFGLGLLWMAIFQVPIILVIQRMCSRIGLVAGGGLTSVIKRKYSSKIVFLLSVLFLVANTLNIGADIRAMSASVRLVFPGFPVIGVILSLALLIVASRILLPHSKYVRALKYLTISSFAYIITAVMVGSNWHQILASTIIPHIDFVSSFPMMFIAIIGTAITPYVFFWHTLEKPEKDRTDNLNGVTRTRKGFDTVRTSTFEKLISKTERSMKLDTTIGVVLPQIIMWAIIVTSASTLHVQKITNLQTASQAAQALQPLVKQYPNASEIAKTIFACGVISTGLLAIPVMAGSSAYAMSAMIGWKQGSDKKGKPTRAFYIILAVSTIIGLAINLSHTSPIIALVYTSAINGTFSIPVLVSIMKIANDKRILKDKTNGQVSNLVGWATVIIIGTAVMIMITIWAAYYLF